MCNLYGSQRTVRFVARLKMTDHGVMQRRLASQHCRHKVISVSEPSIGLLFCLASRFELAAERLRFFLGALHPFLLSFPFPP